MMDTDFMLGIPAFNTDAKDNKNECAVHKGGGCYVKTINNVTSKEYSAYITDLIDHGFTVYADNTKDGIGGTVFSSTYTKDRLVLTATYYAMENRVTISAYTGLLSGHLLYDESYLAGNVKGARTKLYMCELWRLGNSFIFQLKNNHFVISDGGLPADLPYLLDFLESLVPSGETPHIEGWIITHPHADHCGALFAFGDHTDWLSRITCDGVYVNEPDDDVLKECRAILHIPKVRWAVSSMKDSEGNPTLIYRPQTGQRYYFNDITMDILLCQEEVPPSDYKRDINNASIVCMFTVEGQKCFFSGDIHQPGLEFIMRNYTKDYLTLDIFTLNHHGFNVSIPFTDYATIKTLLLTLQDPLPVRHIRDTRYMISKAKESMKWGDGTKVLTFPYTVGSYKCLPKKEWIYNKGDVRPLQMNIYTFHNAWANAFITDADMVLFEDGKLKEDVPAFIKLVRERKVPLSVYSRKTSSELMELLKKHGIADCFSLIMGSDNLDPDDFYSDAFRKSEEFFGLKDYRRFVILCCSMDAIDAAVYGGYKTAVIKQGREITDEMNLKGWLIMDNLKEITSTPLREFAVPKYLKVEPQKA